ncbi:Calmodulin-binding protein 25 [Linum perenne]
MASSSENLSLFDSWTFRPSFPDSWISESYSRESDALTKALQQSLYSDSFITSSSLPSSVAAASTSPDTPTPISCSSDPDSTTAAPKPKPIRSRGNTVPGATGKVSKRKPRVSSKKSQTTFITADPANFRQMVQQVTGGIRFTDNLVPVLKPEPHRISAAVIHHHLEQVTGGLPTLDTSTFLLNHQIQQQEEEDDKTVAFNGGEVGPLSYSQPMVSSGDFDSFSSFPTLESWKVIN